MIGMTTRGTHNRRTLLKARETYAVYADDGTLHSAFPRVCVRCGRPISGYSFRTIYGIFVTADGTRLPVAGEPLHDVCPEKNASPRVVEHNPDDFFRERRKINRPTSKMVEPFIDALSNGKFQVRAGRNKRLGTFDTLDEARAARAAYLKRTEKHERQQKRKRK